MPCLFLFLVVLCGCTKDNKNSAKIEQLKIVRGGNQCALHGEYFKNDLVIEAFGPLSSSWFGISTSHDPVEGARIVFEVLDTASGMIVECENPFTDHGGAVRAKVKAGNKTGDFYVKAYPENNPQVSVTARFICGISVKGNKQEGRSESVLADPFEILVQGQDSKPLAGVPVYFQVVSSPESKTSAVCKPSSVKTDGNGIALTYMKLGSATGPYKVLAEISDPANGIFLRGIELYGMGLNLSKLIFIVFCGLAVFIFGMNLMSDGLQLVAGDKMREILKFFTGNRFTAVAAGTVVTGAIQSSSATTVMVVGFVNAGLMSLAQAIGVIFGANIGTTFTAQIISFKINDIAFPSIIAGVIMFLLARKSILKGWGQALLGFGLLFYGMTMMGDELKNIADFPSFINFFRTFDCSPVDGRLPLLSVLGAIGIGTIMTVLIQSSSATIGIALALATSGLLNFWTAVPLILGDNIGTTITAVLASIRANERAKQAALSHVMFNVFGVCYMVVLFFIPFPNTDIPIFMYFINSITPGDVFSEIPQNIERHIAMSHSMFNVFNVILFLPFIQYFEKICNKLIVVKDEKLVKTTLLEPHLLDTPSAAIGQVVLVISAMIEEAFSIVRKAMEENFLLSVYNEENAKEIAEREARIDAVQEEATEYLVQITSRTLTEKQAELIPLLMHCVNDAERIADHAENILELAHRLSNTKNKLSEDAITELKLVWETLKREAQNTMEYFKKADINSVKNAIEEEKKIDSLSKKYESEHITRMKKGKCKVRAGIIYIEMLSELEKIGDHIENIAERTPLIIENRKEI